LSEPYNKIVKQLSKLALQELYDNQLVFTYDNLKVICPDVIAMPEAINGLGLLQAVQHFKYAGKTVTFVFLSDGIQEYLAVHNIINYLSLDEVLCEKIWSNIHANIFAIYVALTRGQQPVFKQFLCGRDDKAPLLVIF